VAALLANFGEPHVVRLGDYLKSFWVIAEAKIASYFYV
jgi:hypothetical protein